MDFLSKNNGFLRFMWKKLLSSLGSFWVIVTLTFFLMKLAPGDPLSQEKALSEEIHQNLATYYGLDKPLLEQYFNYLKNILAFNLGPSLVHSGRTVSQVIIEGFPVSGLLGMEALVIAFSIGTLAGTVSALKKDHYTGSLILIASGLCMSIPSFILGTLLQYIFGIQLAWLPYARWDSAAHMLLPTVALAAMPAAFLTKLVRANMSDVLRQDYIFFAQAKGLPMKHILVKHALRNALIPLFGYLGKMSANILVGSFIIEKIFTIPGLGYWFVGSIAARDYPMIMGLTVFYSAILLSSLFAADIGHALLDSRIYRKEDACLI